MKRGFAVLIAAAMALILLPVAAQAAGNITVSINGATPAEYASLDAAIAASGVSLANVESIEITAGEVETADWEYIKNVNVSPWSVKLPKLTKLAVGSGVTEAANLPKDFLIIPSDVYPKSPIAEAKIAKVESIGQNAFTRCISLTTASFPDAASIGWGAFNNCSALESTSFPEVTSIDGGAFDNCHALETASFPEATSIGKGAFDSCSSLKTVSFPEATSIGHHAFRNCSSLASANFPEATSIGGSAFESCSSLAAASFPKAASIDTFAFYKCSSLASLSLPETPPTVANIYAFDGCPAVRSITLVDADGAPLTEQALNDAIDAYKADGGYSGDKWHGWTLPAPATVRTITVSINGGAAITADSLKAAIIASNVPLDDITSIEVTGGEVETADWDYIKNENKSTPKLAKLATLTVGDLVTSAADLPENFLHINIATTNISPIEQVNIAKVKTVGVNAFTNCVCLNTAVFPDATSVKDGAFGFCDVLTTADFPKAELIEMNAFAMCIKLTSASFPNATSIGESSFNGCTALTSLSLPAKPPTVVHSNAFNGCPAVRNLTLVDADGKALKGQALNDAIDAYKADSGYSGDKWYGWTLPAPALTFAVTVYNGTGGGNYSQGDTVTVTANTPSPGSQFKEWTTSDGVTFADSTATTTTFVMPDRAVTVTAMYEPMPKPPINITPSATITQGSAPNNLTINIGSAGSPPNEASHFGSLEISADGTSFKTVDSSKYSLSYGSIHIALKQSYLNTLTPGTYTLRVFLAGAYADTALTTQLTVTAPVPPPPKTGDNGTPLVWLSLLLICGAGLATLLARRRRGA